MQFLTEVNQEVFTSMLTELREEYANFLKEKNDQKEFKHRRLRSAFRSLKTSLPYLFTYKKFPELNVPNTTNSCDGSFSHWKQKVKIHRGMIKERQNKRTNYLLDLLRDHVRTNDTEMISPDHVCSTLVARVLRQAIGVEKYAKFVDEAKKSLGHQRAYPELVYAVSKLAHQDEVNELATRAVTVPHPQ